jgi:hypothetical protein
MRESEARLRHDLEAVNGRVRRLGRDMLLLEKVPTERGHFTKAVTNLLVVCTHTPQLPYLVLVDDDLRYAGGDPFLARVFSDQPQANGWRPLLLAPGHLTRADLAEVARAALRLLGFPALAASAVPRGLSSDWGFREAYPPLVGREALLQEAEAVLAQQTERAAVVLVGPSGVGKTALARELVWRWQEKGDGRRGLRVSVPALLAGSPLQAGRAEQMLPLGPSALLVVEDLHLACGGPVGPVALARAIEEGLHLVATIGPAAVPLLGGPTLRRRLHFIPVLEPTPQELTKSLLPTVARYLEVRYGVGVARPSQAVALALSAKQPGAQPGKVVRMLDRALARARSRGLEVLGPDDLFGVERSQPD